MSQFTISCDIDVALKLTNSKTLKGDLLKAKTQAMVYYLEELIHKHFDKPNANMEYKYRPNTMKYEIWKKKNHPDALYQMVLSGRLRNAVLNGKVDRSTGKISFNIPEYGLYQLQADRDFTSPSFYDNVVIQNKIRDNLFFIRSNRAKLFAKSR
jgi:hypothetical protein